MNGDRYRLLAEEIGRLLTKGFSADDKVDTYLASTFSNPTTETVKKVIADEAHVERDSLVDLLLFPDETFQIELEPYLTQLRLTSLEVQNVARFLVETKSAVVVHLPALDGHIRLWPTHPEISRLIIRLNMTWQVPQPLYRAIKIKISENKQNLLGVRLRNAALDLDDVKVDFLCDFLDAYNDVDGDFWNYFSFIIDILSKKLKSSIYAAIVQEKHLLIDRLRQAVKFETLLRQSNMETLMLTGVRPPAESATFFRNRIVLIENIIANLFDRA